MDFYTLQLYMWGKEMKIRKKDLRIGIVLKAVVVLGVLYGISMEAMVDTLFYTKFTNLSNLGIGIIFAVFLFRDCRNLERTERLYKMKYICTLCIALTGILYGAILGPGKEGGLLGAYFHNFGGSFCVHFVVPILSFVDFFLCDYEYEGKKQDAVLAAVPPLLYTIFVSVLGYSGLRWGAEKTMWGPYKFLNFGAPTGWFGFDLSTAGRDSIGIGIFYFIAVASVIFVVFGFAVLALLRKRGAKIKEAL